jgi:hypothetical protein
MSLVTLCAARSAKLPESSKFVVALRGNWHASAIRAGDDRPHDASGWAGGRLACRLVDRAPRRRSRR